MNLRVLENGSVTTPAGFTASGIKAGLKKSGQPDMALLFCSQPAVVAAAFTSNVFAAAPVQWDRQILASGKTVRAVIINSGNANACTGKQGLEDARRMAAKTAELLKVQPEEVLVSSTGRIGVPMPMPVIQNGIQMAVRALSSEGGKDAAKAIMTTDTRAKHLAVSCEIGGKTIHLGGMTKGSGMIAPQMLPCPPQATMLAYLTTDAVIEQAALHACLADCLDQSFNRIIVDGDTSTNDTFIALASNLAGNPVIIKGTEDCRKFCLAFRQVAGALAREMVLDGEGVTHFVELQVHGTESDADARRVAEAIARSPLCKTAWFGGDPNWGRILAAAGYSGVQFNPDEVDLDYEDIPIVRGGRDAGTPESEQVQTLKGREIHINLKLGPGQGAFTIWTCDLSYEYVKINADYHT
ncbi:MAG: bifunctional glutamate N-acetyltransferase/amino-acid acetyltransferase ArgJ [Lentisphaeria bacterium]|nr:bifunctional glutamate N-acetyltransferase/amino-acid acetyltransferase ArgJ [Lentisphaeria bacterium]